MRGHQQVITARSRGVKPSAIFFEVGFPAKPPKASRVLPGSLAEALYDPEAAMDSNQLPVVYVADGDLPDLRFAYGCSTHLSGPKWTQHLIALGQALAEAGASRVIVNAIAESDDLMIYDHGEWTTA